MWRVRPNPLRFMIPRAAEATPSTSPAILHPESLRMEMGPKVPADAGGSFSLHRQRNPVTFKLGGVGQDHSQAERAGAPPDIPQVRCRQSDYVLPGQAQGRGRATRSSETGKAEDTAATRHGRWCALDMAHGCLFMELGSGTGTVRPGSRAQGNPG